MSSINEIADDYVSRFSALNPIAATSAGISGHDDLMPDLSPAGFDAITDLSKATLAAITRTQAADAREQTAKEAMIERLTIAIERYDIGDITADVNVVASWVQGVRQVFDLMPTESDESRQNVIARMRQVPAAYQGLRRTYLEAAARGHVAPRRQVLACAKQCAEWSAAGSGFYYELARRLASTGTATAELDRAAELASAGTAEFGRFLETELLPIASEHDAVGRDRFALASRYFLGATIDAGEAYAWGWSEVIRIGDEMRRIAAKIVPGGSVTEAAAALDADPERRISGRLALRDWMQEVADAAIAELNGAHFDIPEPARRIEAMIAPTGDGGIYYTGPSEDWARPGRMWWALPAGLEDFSTWKELTTIYHEGVPGHHLQVAQTIHMRDRLNRWQRLFGFVPGHGEGWALYAERLMDDLGYLADPGNKLGMLDGQLLRAARVVVDIGLHAELRVPADSSWRPGEQWNADLVWEYLRSLVQLDDQMLRFEVDRYLGWPGQASCYKLGERIWLSARDEVRHRQGAAFDLKRFHSQALALGPLGLDPLRVALTRL
jgi:uncharacterized protein (DUF885 family)